MLCYLRDTSISFVQCAKNTLRVCACVQRSMQPSESESSLHFWDERQSESKEERRRPIQSLSSISEVQSDGNGGGGDGTARQARAGKARQALAHSKTKGAERTGLEKGREGVKGRPTSQGQSLSSL